MAHHASPPTVSGSIACYKLLDLASKLTQAGAVVDVIMTDAATRFATPLAFQSITGHPAHTSLWSNDAHVLHVGLAERADVMLIAPAMDGSMSRTQPRWPTCRRCKRAGSRCSGRSREARSRQTVCAFNHQPGTQSAQDTDSTRLSFHPCIRPHLALPEHSSPLRLAQSPQQEHF
jgi:hypothetical protein